MLVIGLIGVKTAGKSTVADMIKSIIPEVTESSLACKLKDVCSSVFNIPRNYFDDQNFKERPLDKKIILSLDEIEAVLLEFNILLTKELIDQFEHLRGWGLSSAREVAQIIGTEVLRRAGSPEIHCEQMKIASEKIIVSDVRFRNEHEYFSKLPNCEFIPLYIQRDEAEALVTEKSHSSEKEVFTFRDLCVKIDNNGSLEQTRLQLERVLNGK